MNKHRFSLLTALIGLGITSLAGISFDYGAKADSQSHVEITDNANSVVVPDKVNNKKLANGDFTLGVALVKTKEMYPRKLESIKYTKIEKINATSDWYRIYLNKKDLKSTKNAIDKLFLSNNFDEVDFDYIMGADAIPSFVEENPYVNDQNYYLENTGVIDGWEYQKQHNLNPGGSKDVVVAVIDTGVDYKHPDLMNNIWHNPGEIPHDGVDNDNNGYVDDYYGYDFVGKDSNPIDDNGHGTHVAGIIGAENNKKGVVGIAYNTKIMCLKAGNSSGYFNSSDIAEAITYAYMNGASVINMSFGGYNLSSLVQEALQNAYLTTILVAAAGNDSMCNNSNHITAHKSLPMFPASLPYVIGVMSCDQSGTFQSLFSNYDHDGDDYYEYEIYAPGENIISTWPNKKYAKLNGTSMAAPIVSGIAALLRSSLTDREVYSNKYIQAQITKTNSNIVRTHLFVDPPIKLTHSCVNYLEALVTNPKPDIKLTQTFIFDDKSISPNNNGDGIIDAGETIDLGVELLNRGGASCNTTVTIDANRVNDKTDPYINIIKNKLDYTEIGTYVAKDGTKIFDENKNLIGMKNCFRIEFSKNCPNNYLADINLRIESRNKLDNSDNKLYINESVARLLISAGMKLPNSISQDMILKSDKTYLLDEPVTIAKNATLTFEEGCHIEVIYPLNATSKKYMYINVFGTINFNGKNNNPIQLYCSNAYQLVIKGNGNFNATCTKFYNVTHDTSMCKYNVDKCEIYIDNVGNVDNIAPRNVNNSYIEFKAGYLPISIEDVKNSVVNIISPHNYSGLYHHIRISKCHNVIFESLNVKDSSYNIYSKYCVSECSGLIFKDLNPYDHDIPLIPLALEHNNSDIVLKGNYNSQKLKYVENYYDQNGAPRAEIVLEDKIAANLPAYVKSFVLLDSEGNIVTHAGKNITTFKLTFNKKMDTTKNPLVTFGSQEPFSDYFIPGKWVNDTTWQGEYSIKAEIENGNQYLNVKNAYSADNEFISCASMYKELTFNVDTVSAMSMNINAIANSDGSVSLKWVQDDYDTLMGYNVYRSDDKDGNFVKLNTSIIPQNENTFIDYDAEPGKNYWYTFTVILTDFSESRPAGKTSCTTYDTLLPRVYHTPVNQGYVGSNLIITCLANDNVGVVSAVLYYRTKGDTNYKSIQMSKNNDKYSAFIFGYELDTKGLEYYIEIKDSYNSVYKGSKDNPYQVIIKDASTISETGDVDGDGKITTKDALMIMQALEGKIILTDDQFKRADLNKDNKLSSIEALRILQFINGNVDTLIMGA